MKMVLTLEWGRVEVSDLQWCTVMSLSSSQAFTMVRVCFSTMRTGLGLENNLPVMK